MSARISSSERSGWCIAGRRAQGHRHNGTDSARLRSLRLRRATARSRRLVRRSFSEGGSGLRPRRRKPGSVTKRLGRYEVPVFRLGRLAVAITMQGKGLGGGLLLAAGARALAVAGEVGGVALAIDAKDDRAAAWYERFGALRLLDDRLKLVLPLDVIAAALNVE